MGAGSGPAPMMRKTGNLRVQIPGRALSAV
jgi:hypothetical protein